ncbi:MAG: hypothetical protein Q9M97_10420 [Candidatus Gracilibacteria bacterium]|nr:hypothetical protein [Candidatus Gracilibacteria bacterium]
MEKLDEIYLGVDEHSFSGHDMVLIITELKTGQLLAVLDGITKNKIRLLDLACSSFKMP